jgi:hypothetical protein
MVARSNIVFPESMAAILTNPVEICFGSFTLTSTVLAAMTSLVDVAQIATMSVATPASDPASETDPPKPYDMIQGMKRVISMMEDTL